ncbi:MAG: radical SAM protein [Candidatus Bathyarchaeota archaeon]|nr:radical SAM protein [Candidatus Bathyarchaeota archaeon]
MPKKVRVSIGSAVVLGLAKGRLDAAPTTVYLLAYRRGKCSAGCAFCPQSKTSSGRADMLSRVVWPVFQTEDVTPRVAEAFSEGKISRACIQALNYPTVQEDLVSLARRIRARSKVPISVSCQPLTNEGMIKLAEAGVKRVSIALDAVTKELFEKVKGTSVRGPYTWEGHLETLKGAAEVFGRDNVTTHLIAGLGENEEEFVRMIQRCVDSGIYPAVFAFTPIPGTVMANHPAPSLNYYRRLQIARHLIVHKTAHYEDMRFKDGWLVDFGVPSEELRKILRTGEPFKTSGCPGCNRPYYNEPPRGPLYNFPKKPSALEISAIEKVLFTDEHIRFDSV